MIQPASQEEIQRRNAELEGRDAARIAELEAEIAERQVAEARLREREERLRLITENITEFFWLSDAAISQIEYASPAYEQIWRRPVAELHAHPESFLAAVEPEDLPALQENLAGHALGLPYEMEYRIRWPDGSLRWIWDRGFPIRDADGQVRRYAGLAQDITARRRLEEELRALNATLERRVEERTAEIRAAQAALQESESRYRTIFNSVSDGILIQDPADGEIIDVNEPLAAQYGGSREEVLAAGFGAILTGEPPYSLADAQAKIQRVHTEGPQTFEWRVRRRDGSPFWAEVSLSLSLIAGQPRILALTRDISARKAAEQALRESEERFRTLFEDTRQPLALMEDDRFIAANQATLRMLGAERPEQVIGRTAGDFSPPILADGQASVVKAAAMIRLAYEQGTHEFEWESRRVDGAPFPSRVLLTAIRRDKRRLLHVVWNDISAQKQAQARAEYLAYYDALTGLPNRLLGLDRLSQKLAQAQRHQRSLALLYLDLDRFKLINDRYGHLQGDHLLNQFGLRLSRRLRAEDTLCRLGADEFMLVLPEVRNQQPLTDLASLCERLIGLGSDPFDLDGHQVYVDLSIGVAIYPRDGSDGETLMRHADIALYAAKRAGRKTYCFFDPGMNAALTRFIETREALRMALECEEFVLHYQPQIELSTGRLVGVEALVRWQRPEVGLVMPGEFIDVAEESGLIVPLGRWVLVEACRQAAAWRASGWPDLVVAVNVSAAQFRRGSIGAEVLAVLAATGLAPAGLEIELTESLLMEGQEAALATVAQWQARGIQLAIDDFGTGYSSLAYLKRFAADKIKIDRSFIVGMVEHDADRAIVQAIIDLAGGLKLRTIAEGVEDVDLATQLQRMGCDEAQGYLYAPPLAAADLEGWLRARGKG